MPRGLALRRATRRHLLHHAATAVLDGHALAHLRVESFGVVGPHKAVGCGQRLDLLALRVGELRLVDCVVLVPDHGELGQVLEELVSAELRLGRV
eukprot:149775-Prorocentrum_minimum.AAC.1